MIFLAVVPIMPFMPYSLPKQVSSMTIIRLVCNLELVHAFQPDIMIFIVVEAEEGIEGYNTWCYFWICLQEFMICLAIEDNENEVFLKGMFCLLMTVFLALKDLSYCN